MKSQIKNLNLTLSVLVLSGDPSLYTPTVPETSKFSNMNLNALASKYAAQYGHSATSLLQRFVHKALYDAAPKQYADLKILMQNTPEMVGSDEFSYHEIGWAREAVVIGTIPGGGIASATSQTIPIENLDAVALDMILVGKGNSRGTVTAIDAAASTITLTAETGNVLPELVVDDTGETFANLSPVEADGADSITQYFRQETIERNNYVQLLVKAMRIGRVELIKYQNMGTLDGYIEMQKQKMYEQFRVSMSNIIWNGNQAEVTLSNGAKAKTAGGINPIMAQAGSISLSSTRANIDVAIETLALDTEFGNFGERRFLYATPKVIHIIQKKYKEDLVRYTPDSRIADLQLDGINIGSSLIVFVPVKRFEDASCFPKEFASTIFLLDQESIKPCYLIPESTGETLDRVNNGTLKNFKDFWVEGSISLKFNNPLASGKIVITDL